MKSEITFACSESQEFLMLSKCKICHLQEKNPMLNSSGSVHEDKFRKKKVHILSKIVFKTENNLCF